MTITWRLRAPKVYDGRSGDALVAVVFESLWSDEKGAWKWRRQPLGDDLPRGPFASADDAKQDAESSIAGGTS